jgi:hypothetical protein
MLLSKGSQSFGLRALRRLRVAQSLPGGTERKLKQLAQPIEGLNDFGQHLKERQAIGESPTMGSRRSPRAVTSQRAPASSMRTGGPTVRALPAKQHGSFLP